MATHLRKKLVVSDWCHFPGIPLRIPPIDLIVIRPTRHVAQSMQQEGNKPFPIFFGKLCGLFLYVRELNHSKRE
jgi:hypothetical protein